MGEMLTAVVLLAMLAAQGTALLTFSPTFGTSLYDTSESQEQFAIHLTAPILAASTTPHFNGSIKVDIMAVDLPHDDPRQRAEFGSDYVVNMESPQSRTSAVYFEPKKSNSSELVILLTDDNVLEDREYFRIQISAIRFIGQVANLFRAQDGVNNTFMDVYIEDNDTVQIYWTASRLAVTEGDVVRLSGEALGSYAIPLEVGAVCAESIATGVKAAFPGEDFNFTVGTKLHFTDVNTIRSQSRNQLVIPILNDDTAEPRESFVCTLNSGNANQIQAFPNQVVIKIYDDDELVARWAEPYYEFSEGTTSARVELAIESNFVVDQVTIAGFPRQIPNGYSNHIPSLSVPGPVNKDLNASIEQVRFGAASFGNAQVAHAGRTDVVKITKEFIFTPNSTLAFQTFNIVDDDVLEFDELFIAEFQFGADFQKNWKTKKGMPSTAYIRIIDNDFVEVNVNEENLTIIENEGHVSISLCIMGKFFIPLYAVIEVSDGTATDPEDYSSERRYNVTFPQTTFTDKDDPDPFAMSFPISIDIMDDNIVEEAEFFWIRIVETSDKSRVRIGQQDTINVTIIDDDMSSTNGTILTGHWCPYKESETAPAQSVHCSAEEDSVWRIQWPASVADSIQTFCCPGVENTSGLGLAHRRCLGGGVWGSVDATECESVAVRTIRMKIKEFVIQLQDSRSTLNASQRRVIWNITVDLHAALKLSNQNETPIPPQDLKTVARFVEVVADLGENNGLFEMEINGTQLQEVVADILSIILGEHNMPTFEATLKSASADSEYDITATPATSILQSTERVANVIASALFKKRTCTSFTISRPNLVMNGQQFSLSNLQDGAVSFGPGVTLQSFGEPESLPYITLPQSFLLAAKGIEMPKDNDTVELVNVVMNNMENYLPTNVVNEDEENVVDPEETLPASRVLSSQILSYDGGEVDTNDREMVEVIFPLNEKVQNLQVPSGSVKLLRCVFYNFTGGANKTGGWSYRGVETEAINYTHVRCSASHLTSFVVLVSIVPAAGDPPPLDYITYIGCSISLLCLLASIIFLLSLRKEVIKKLHNFVHLNLCTALSLGLLLFLVGIQTATNNIHACKVMTALLHYFFLATFTWTLCEAVLIYILLVKVFGVNVRKWIYFFLAIGWGLPIPIVVITGGVRHDDYLLRSSFNQSHPHYEVIKACWLPSQNGVIYAFIGPMVAIILVNAVLLTISLVSLAKSQCRMASEIRSKRDEKRRKYVEVGKRLLKATIILVPLLGFTWIIGLFAVGEDGKVFAYLFVICNVFQGLFIFLFHIVRHEKVYGKVKSKLQKVTLAIGCGSAAGGTRSIKLNWNNSNKNKKCPADFETMAELGKKSNVDSGKVKEGGNLEVVYFVDEKADAQKVSGHEGHLANASAEFGMNATSRGALEEKLAIETSMGAAKVNCGEQEDKENGRASGHTKLKAATTQTG